LPRPALGNFIRASLKGNAIELEPFCRLNFEAGDAMFGDRFSKVYQQVLEDSGLRSYIGRSRYGPRFYAMLGSLDHAAWQRLRRGEAIRVAYSGERSREAALRYAEASWSVDTESGAEVPPLVLRTEEALPLGLPPDAYITMRTDDVDVAVQSLATQDGQWVGFGGLDADTLGSGLGRSVLTSIAGIEKAIEAGRITPAQAGDYRNPTLESMTNGFRYRMSVHRRVTVDLHAPTDYVIRTQIDATIAEPKGEQMKFRELPEAFRKRAEQAWREAMRKPGNAAGGGG
jgi:hypothetical protein